MLSTFRFVQFTPLHNCSCTFSTEGTGFSRTLKALTKFSNLSQPHRIATEIQIKTSVARFGEMSKTEPAAVLSGGSWGGTQTLARNVWKLLYANASPTIILFRIDYRRPSPHIDRRQTCVPCGRVEDSQQREVLNFTVPTGIERESE